VWKVKNKATKIIYAMKEMSKVKAFKKNSLTFICEERKILMNLNFPFLANLRFSFQDNENLYLILDYFEGGDLRYYLNKKKNFLKFK
jgi:serine/threonine protein kinase